MPKALAFITSSFPFGNGEAFIAQEIPYLAQEFQSITIFPFTANGQPRPLPDKIKVSYELSRPWPCHLHMGSPLTVGFQLIKNLWYPVPVPANSHNLNAAQIFRATFALLKVVSVLRSWHHENPGCDLYFYSYWLGVSTLAARVSKVPFRKIISRAHRVDLYQEENPSGSIPYFSANFQAADEVHFISNHGLRYAAERLPESIHRRLFY